MSSYRSTHVSARRVFLLGPLLLGLVPAVASAQASDPVGAQGHLEHGSMLKDQGRCNEAIPYFLESIRLDRQPKALLSLADCEETMKNLGSASTHFFEARALAEAKGLEPERAMAERRLQAIDERVRPKPADPSPGNGQRIAGFSLMGVGVVGLAVGAIFGMSVPAKNREIDAICPTGEPCPPQSVAEYNNAVADAKIARAAALVGFGVGAVFVATGVVLVLAAPQRASGAAVWLTPAVGSSGAGAVCGGTW